MATQFFLRCLTGLALGVTAFAQAGHGPTGGGAGGPTGRPTNPTQPNGLPGNSLPPDFSQHPLFLTGKVVMEDGTAPTNAAIQLVCRATPRSIGHTDSKGAFSIDVNNRASQMGLADASENASPAYPDPGMAGSGTNGLSGIRSTTPGNGPTQTPVNRDLSGCDLQAAIPGFRSDVLHLSSRKSLDDPNVGILVMHRLAGVEGTTISLTTAMAPKDAKKAMEKAQNALKKDKLEDAQKELLKAVDIYPKFAIAWAELGRIQQRLNDPDDARRSFAMALEADAKLVTPYISLASLAFDENKWQDVSYYTDRALKLNPVDFPQAYLLDALSNYHLKKMDLAEKSARAGIDHDAEHRYADLHEILAVVLLNKRDYPAAAEQFRTYLQYSPDGRDAASARKQLAELERVLSREAKK